MHPVPSQSPLSERALIFVIGAVQFSNILDFMMVMPLGPDFARDLNISTAHLGFIGGAYTASAAVAGILGSLWLERLDRRTALVLSMLGLVVGTVAGGFANSLQGLIGARILAGFWGGPATSVSMSIIADGIPPERRGKAMGAVMGAFSAAAVLGVPAGLELARRGTWRLPFFAVGGLALVVALAAWQVLPPMRGHLNRQYARTSLGSLLRRRDVLLAIAITTVVMAGSFCIIPNIASYVQLNLGFPRERLGGLYLVGGVLSFFATRWVGKLVDQFGAAISGSGGAMLLVVVVGVGYWSEPPLAPVEAIFLGFFLAMAFRNVPVNTIMSMVPGPAERATFMSLQSAVQHLAASLGAFASSRLLSDGPNHRLVGMGQVALLSMGLSLCLPPLLYALQRLIRARPAPAARPTQ